MDTAETPKRWPLGWAKKALRGIRQFLRRIRGIKTPFGGIDLAPPDSALQAETRRELRERFARAVDGLSSGVEARQVSAIAQLEAFLDDAYRFLHAELHAVLCANLVVAHSGSVTRQLVRLFERSLRAQFENGARTGDRPQLNFARCRLARIDLSGLDLSRADLAFADLSAATFRGTTLYDVRGFGVNVERALFHRADLEEARLHETSGSDAQFHRARLVSTKLRDASLDRAEFFGAQMQSAHLDRSSLLGARFEDADLNDAFFTGAIFDDASLRSLARNQTWRKAHFDEPVREKLKDLSS